MGHTSKLLAIQFQPKEPIFGIQMDVVLSVLHPSGHPQANPFTKKTASIKVNIISFPPKVTF